jgi:hypothetical protein
MPLLLACVRSDRSTTGTVRLPTHFAQPVYCLTREPADYANHGEVRSLGEHDAGHGQR